MSQGGVRVEAEPILTVQLDVVREDGSVDSYEEEFSLRALVVQLKQDVEGQVGIQADQQIWTYNHVELDNNSTLLDYPIDSGATINVTTRGF